MRVLMVSKLNTKESYGGSNRAYYLGKYLSDRAEVFQLGVDCSGIDYCASDSTFSLSILRFHKKVREIIERFEPDIVYSFESRANLACKLLRQKGYRSKFVYDFTSSPAFEWETYFKYGEKVPESFYRWLRGFILEKVITSDNVTFIAAGEFLREVLLDRYRVPSDRIFVIPNGAPPEMLDSQSQVFENPYSEDGKKKAVMIGPRDDYTNILAVRFLHRVAEELMRKNEDIKIVILGGGPKLGESSNVDYTGYVEDIRPYLDHADVCLLPYPREAVCGGARLKSFEYFSRKKLVVTTPEGLRGLDLFQHLEHIYLSEDDPQRFADDLTTVINEGSGLGSLGENAYKLVLERYDWEKLAGSLYGILVEALR